MSLFSTFSKLGIPSQHAVFHVFLLNCLFIFLYTFDSLTVIFVIWHAVLLLITFSFVTVLSDIITSLEVEILFVQLVGSDHLDTVFNCNVRARIVFTNAFLNLSQLCNDFLFDTNDLLDIFWLSLSFCRHKIAVTLFLWLNFLYLLYRFLITFYFLFDRVNA